MAKVGQSAWPNAIIIGAGRGGLACAYELRCAGYDVILFESGAVDA
jgi:flavin-dependent dehydrogenase